MEIQEAEKCTLLPNSTAPEKPIAQRWSFLRRLRNSQFYQVERSGDDTHECTYRLLPSSVAEVGGKECSTPGDLVKRMSCEDITDPHDGDGEGEECSDNESSDRRQSVGESSSCIANKTGALSQEENLNDKKKLDTDIFENDFSSSQDSINSDGPQNRQASNRHSKALEKPRNTSEYLTERKNIQAKRLANHFLYNSDDEYLNEKRSGSQEDKIETTGSRACDLTAEINANISKHEPNEETNQCDENSRSSKLDKNSEVLSDPDSHKINIFSSTIFKKNFNPFAKFFNVTSTSTEMLTPGEITSQSESGSEYRKTFYRVNDAFRVGSRDSVSIQTYRKIGNDLEEDMPLVAHSNSSKELDKHSVSLVSEKSVLKKSHDS